MKPNKLNLWRKRQHLASWKEAARRLGLSYAQILRFKSGKEKIPLHIEMACIAQESNRVQEIIEGRVVSYSQILRYFWFWPRIIKAVELPSTDMRRKDIAITLLVALTAVMAEDFAMTPAAILRSVLERLPSEDPGNTQSEAKPASVPDPIFADMD